MRMWLRLKICEHKKEIALFLLCFISYGYFFHGGGANQNATYDQIRSIVEFGDLAINRFVYNTHDVSTYNGNFFPNKAPGLTFLGVPVGFLLFQLKRVFLFFMMEDTYYLLVCHLISWLTVSFISAILCVVLFRFIACLTQCTTTAFIGTMGYAFGTTAFAYSTIMYAHQVSAAFSFIAFFSIFILRDKKVIRFSSLFFPGLLAGYSVITEYPCIFVWSAIFVYVCYLFSHRKKYIGYFLAGSSIPALLLLFYNYLCYGNPIHFGYFSYFVSNADIQSGLKETVKTISFPSIVTLYKITFDPYRGIFFYCPFLLTFLPGVYFFIKRKGVSPEFLFPLAIMVFFFMFNASYQYWYGGWSLGPRHLVVMIPFTVLLSSFFVKQYPKISICLVFVSFFIMLMAVFVTPETPSSKYKNPVVEFYFENFFRSDFSLNKVAVFTSNVFGDEFNSYNLGSVLALPGALPVLAFCVILVIGIVNFIYRAELGISGIFRSPWFISKVYWGAGILKNNAVYFKLSLIVLLVTIIGIQIVIAIPGRKEETSDKKNKYVVQPGFMGRYYDNKVFSGKAKLVRYDDSISFTDISFREIFSDKAYSVIWSGRLYVPKSGIYKFITESDDGSFLYINDRLVVNNGGDHVVKTVEGPMYLSKGYCDIKVKYFNSTGSGQIKVFWEKPGGLKHLIGGDDVHHHAIRLCNNDNFK